MRACEIESYEEDGEVYNQDKLLVGPHDLIFMKEHIPEKFVSGKPFLTTTQLFKIPGNAFYSGARIGSIDSKTCGSCSNKSGSI
jgi:hypothetical protein